jgi:hypothetical protein
VNFTIDDKPTVCLVHKMGMMEGNVYIYSQIHFYVSRGHNSVQGVGGAFPLGDQESAIIYGSRTYSRIVREIVCCSPTLHFLTRAFFLSESGTSTDQVSGFGGSAKRTIGSRVMMGKIAKNLQDARAKFNP